LRSCTAAILAGGLGTRLRSVVADRPKVLAEVAGRPYLAHLLDQLADAGIRRCVLCTGHLGDQVEEAFGAHYRGMTLDYSREPEPLGTGGAMRHALPYLEGHQVLVLNGDSFCRVDLNRFQAFHVTGGTSASLVLVEVPDAGRYGQVEVTADGRVVRFQEKVVGAGRGWINAGIYLLDRAVIGAMPPGVVSLERQVFPSLVLRGLRGFRTEGPFLDIGMPESYRAAERFFEALALSGKDRHP
jgi:NDP-sugar pyrophosphorylase family protein